MKSRTGDKHTCGEGGSLENATGEETVKGLPFLVLESQEVS